ncbi:hypothetical protein [Streptomyces olivaceiscleroticus]|uniref:ATP-dependent DNA ligase family profile domain-containing protein n=1 Tax=Streptomyces olivaceiscleroticus TaxID=68245 RepID=A0ABN0ZLD7_9ACTN
MAFEYLARRLNRRAATAARLAEQHPARFVAFDLLHQAGDADLTACPYAERRAALEARFVEYGLGPPWTLCPMITDEATAGEWLWWSVVGIEGCVFKREQQPYIPGKRAGGWRKYRVRESTEAIVGAVTGSVRRPGTLLLGRLDAAGRLRYVGRTTQLAAGLVRDLAAELTPAGPEHPWRGRTFSAGWGTNDTLDVGPVTVAAGRGCGRCRRNAPSMERAEWVHGIVPAVSSTPGRCHPLLGASARRRCQPVCRPSRRTVITKW